MLKLLEITQINLEFIDDPSQPMRQGLDQQPLEDLASSIREKGIINPITVRKKGERYEVVAGHRRFRAAGMAGVFRIPCVVADVSDDEAFDIMAHENLYRQDLDPVEEAISYGRIVGEDVSKIAPLAKRINRSVVWLEDRLELLTFSDEILAALKQGKIKLGVAQWLGRIEDRFWQEKFLREAVNFGMTVLQAQYFHDQFYAGLYPKEGDIMPTNEELKGPEPRKLQVTCARCGKVAVAPNFRNVFIHEECPENEPQPASVPGN